MTDKLIEAVARAMAVERGMDPDAIYTTNPEEAGKTPRTWRIFEGYARAAIAAVEAAGYDLVLRQHRDMGPGFTHHDGANCPCFAAAPKVGK